MTENEKLKKLADKLEEDTTFNEELLDNTIIKMSGKIAKWQALYGRKLWEFEELDLKRGKVYKELFYYYKFEFELQLDKKELETFIKSDEKYITIMKELKEIEVILKFIEEALKNLNNFNWNIRNWIEYKKLAGDY